MLRALLDANVLISAAVRPSGPPGEVALGLLSRNAFELVISPGIIAEVERALGQKTIRKYLRDSREALLWLADIVAVADVVEDAGRDAALGAAMDLHLGLPGVCRDPADDRVLGAALEGRADVIVTGNRDLLALEEHEGIAILDPRGFLGLLKREVSSSSP